MFGKNYRNISSLVKITEIFEQFCQKKITEQFGKR